VKGVEWPETPSQYAFRSSNTRSESVQALAIKQIDGERSPHPLKQGGKEKRLVDFLFQAREATADHDGQRLVRRLLLKMLNQECRDTPDPGLPAAHRRFVAGFATGATLRDGFWVAKVNAAITSAPRRWVPRKSGV
jgi:hypothetical protein